MTPARHDLIVLAATAVLALAGPRVEAVDFNREVRPILSDACFQCHGPDADERKADLRLDTQEGAISVIRGVAGQSELIARVTATDPQDRMPPPDSGNR